MNTLCKLSTDYGPVVGRVLLAAIFIMAGFNKIPGFEQTAGYMTSKGLPMVDVLLALTIIIELGGGLMILLGFFARYGAAALFLFCIPVTLMFHDFWNVADPQGAYMQQLFFMKNLAIMGGLAMVGAFGSGKFSIKQESC